jgi:hypothetical protein
MFCIVEKETRKICTYPSNDGEPILFSTGANAARYIDDYFSFKRGVYTVLPYSASNTGNWRDRENIKFAKKELYLPPRLKDIAAKNPDHYLALSKESPPLLTYFKDEQKAQDNKRSKISIRGYLEKYFPKLSEAARKKIETEYLSYDTRLKFATTPAQIVKAYLNYAAGSPASQSCMRRRYKTQHPTSVYGAGDLAIAYLVNEAGKVTERSLVWPEKKIYGRVYGTSLLHTLLQGAGYKKSDYYPENRDKGNSFNGARLLKIPYNQTKPNARHGEFLMPYIDGPIRVVMKEDHFVITDKGVIAKSTAGHIFCAQSDEDVTDFTCETCLNTWSHDQKRTAYNGITDSAILICRRCFTDSCVHSNLKQRAYLQRTTVRMESGDFWPEFYFKTHGFLCQRSGKGYTNRAIRYKVTIKYGGNRKKTQIWSRKAVAKFGQNPEVVNVQHIGP